MFYKFEYCVKSMYEYGIWKNNLDDKFSGFFDRALSNCVSDSPAFRALTVRLDESEEGSDRSKTR
jgi:hypothetical protein